eukprot:GHVU01111973.1.p1 GENE.GHVU01111973.1~~GHVU01111973.1.p1  ORF type:complete len:205 (+),score=1.65 GHVU01111973.1:135-749(+)
MVVQNICSTATCSNSCLKYFFNRHLFKWLFKIVILQALVQTVVKNICSTGTCSNGCSKYLLYRFLFKFLCIRAPPPKQTYGLDASKAEHMSRGVESPDNALLRRREPNLSSEVLGGSYKRMTKHQVLPKIRAPRQFNNQVCNINIIYIVLFLRYFANMFHVLSSFYEKELSWAHAICPPCCFYSPWHTLGHIDLDIVLVTNTCI